MPEERMREHPCLCRGLLVCGMLAAALYPVADVAGGLSWPGYSFSAQTISELSAVEAPSRPVMIPIFALHNLLLIAFAAGIWIAAAGTALRVTAIALVAIAAAGFAAPVFGSMHVRGDQPMATGDVIHIALTVLIVACIFAAVGFSAVALGPRFRLYALATVGVMLVFGALAALDGPRIARNLPTPRVGIFERIDVYAYDLWIAVLAVALLRRPARASRPGTKAAPGRPG